MATTGTYYHAAHWHHLTRQPLAPIYFPIESAFEYSHQLNRNESSNGFHILRSHFCSYLSLYFEIESAFEYSHQLNIAWHSRKITVA